MDYISSTMLMLLTIIVLGALLITILTRLSEINKTLTIMRLELSTLKNSLANKVHSADEKPEEAVQKKSEQKTTIQKHKQVPQKPQMQRPKLKKRLSLGKAFNNHQW